MASGRYHHGDLRAASVRAALSLIESDGAAAVSVRRVAREIGVSHTAVGKELGGLEGLLVAAAAAIYDGVAEAQLVDPAVVPDARERFRAVGRGYVRYLLDHPRWLGFLGHPVVQGSTDAGLAGARERAVAELMWAVEAAMDAEAIRRDHPETVATFVWSTCFGFAGLVAGGALPWESENDPVEALLDQLYLGLQP